MLDLSPRVGRRADKSRILCATAVPSSADARGMWFDRSYSLLLANEFDSDSARRKRQDGANAKLPPCALRVPALVPEITVARAFLYLHSPIVVDLSGFHLKAASWAPALGRSLTLLQRQQRT